MTGCVWDASLAWGVEYKWSPSQIMEETIRIEMIQHNFTWRAVNLGNSLFQKVKLQNIFKKKVDRLLSTKGMKG